VVADAHNNPRWIAADLLSQAEHDPIAQSVLICDDAEFANAVQREIDDILSTLARAEIARASWQQEGVILMVQGVNACEDWINLIAPEHLELALENPESLAARVQHAGAIFMGRYTPEAIGDYMAGPSHVLPTTRAARYSSGLSVYNFLKKSSIIGCTPSSLQAIAHQADVLAQCEGLSAHGLSLRLRLPD
jgi:histidinol dehydrogenase